jgi:hypothetical protein
MDVALLAEVYGADDGGAAAEAVVLQREPLTVPELERLLSASFGTNGSLLGPLAINTSLFSFIAWRGLRAQDALNLACASRGIAAAIPPGVWRHFLQLERFDAKITVRDALAGGSAALPGGLTLAESGAVDAEARRAFFARRSPYHGITSVPPATWCDACNASFDGVFRCGYAGAPLGVSIAADGGAAAAAAAAAPDESAAPDEELARLSERTACPRCVARWLRPSARAERTSGGSSSGGGGGSSTSVGSVDHTPVEAASLWSIGSNVASMVKRTLVARRSADVDGGAARPRTSVGRRRGLAIRASYSLPNIAHEDLEVGDGLFEAIGASPRAPRGASPRESGGGGGGAAPNAFGGAAALGSWEEHRAAPRFAGDGRLLATFAPLRETLSDAEVDAARATCSALVLQERWRHRGQRRKWIVSRPYRVRAAGEFLCTVTFYANLAHSLTRSP